MRSKEVFKRGYNNERCTAHDLVVYELSESNYDTEKIDDISYEVENIKKFLGRLIQFLYETKKLTRDQVYEIAKGNIPMES